MRNEIQRNYFDCQTLNKAGGVARFFDRTSGNSVSKFRTNWLNGKNSLPNGRSMLVAKIGIDLAHSDDTPVEDATIAKIRKGILTIKHNSEDVREYRLAEFLASPAKSNMEVKCGTIYIPFEAPEIIKGDIPLDVYVEYPSLPVDVDLTINLKGVESHSKIV